MKEVEIIKNIIIKNNFNWRLIVSKIKKQEKLLKFILTFTNSYPKNINLKNRIILILFNKREYLKCKQCNKEIINNVFISLNLKTITDKYFIDNLNFFCSKKCSGLYTSYISKQTCLKKYGVDNPAKLKFVQTKIKKTMKEKYGVEHALQSKEIQKKMKEKNLEKYGKDSILQIKEFQEKIKQTNLKKYGFEHAIQNDKIKNKIKHTCLEKYNVDNPMKSTIVKDKLIQTIHNKTLNNIKKYCKLQNIEFLSESYNGSSYDFLYRWKCLKCNNIFEHCYYSGRIPRCPKCYPIKNNSYQQHEIIDFIKSLGINDLQTNTRKIIAPKELDIYIASYNIAIEYNGLYWHSEEYKNSNYHIEKTKDCQKINIKLIHIFEDEWVFQKQIVKNRIKHILGLTKYKIYGRKCIIREIDNETKNKFLEKYHIQRCDNSSIRLGAFYKNRLVAVMTFGKPRYNKNYQWELIRFCTIGNFTIIGIANKLLKYFERNYQPINIVSYADLRWSDGKVYEKLNFQLSHISNPNYSYVKDNIRLSRINFQKHKLKNILNFYKEELTESENVLLNGFFKVYDCGNLVFVKKYIQKNKEPN